MTLYHMIIEGALALTGQHFIIEYNTEQDTLPGFVEGFQNVARDEHRHIAFGVRFLTDMAKEDERYREAIQRTMAEALPVADKVLDPPWAEEDDWEHVRVLPRRDARLRRPVPVAAAEGDRPRLEPGPAAYESPTSSPGAAGSAWCVVGGGPWAWSADPAEVESGRGGSADRRGGVGGGVGLVPVPSELPVAEPLPFPP